MKKLLLIGLLWLAACAPHPNDFPPRPPTAETSPPVGMTVIVELPIVTVVSTPTPNPQLILPENLSDAENFFLLLKLALLAGDQTTVAEAVRYPLNVRVNGQMTTLRNADELLKNYDQVFNPNLVQALTNTSETDLTNLPDGLRVGNGQLWLGRFCLAADCREPVFWVMRINN